MPQLRGCGPPRRSCDSCRQRSPDRVLLCGLAKRRMLTRRWVPRTRRRGQRHPRAGFRPTGPTGHPVPQGARVTPRRRRAELPNRTRSPSRPRRAGSPDQKPPTPYAPLGRARRRIQSGWAEKTTSTRIARGPPPQSRRGRGSGVWSKSVLRNAHPHHPTPPGRIGN